MRSESWSPYGTAWVAVAAAGWTAVVGGLAAWRHTQFLTHRADLGNMVQAVWSSAHGGLLDVTDGATGEQISRLAAHVDPILVLFVPFWWLHPAPETLIAIQAAAISTGVYPVVRLALKHVRSAGAAALLGLWYLIFPWVLWNAVNDVHPVTLSIPLLLWAIWFLDESRLASFAIVTSLALLTGELVGLTVAVLGIWYAVAHRRMRAGLLIAVAGASWTALCLLVVIPAVTGGESSRFYERFETVGGSPTGVVRTLFTDPGAISSALTTHADVSYVLLLLVPTAFLAFGAPLLAAAALPQLGVNLLSDFWSTTQPMFQYVAPTVPPFVAATIVAIGKLPGRYALVASIAPLAASAVLLASLPPVPGSQEFVFAPREPSARIEAMRQAMSRVPPTAAVTSTNRLGAHLSARRQVFLFPERSAAEWIILDTSDEWLQVSGEEVDATRFRSLLLALEDDASWNLVFDREGIRLYRKRTP